LQKEKDSMKFNAYLDGFNLYKGLLTQHPSAKWLDLRSFCQSNWLEIELQTVYYFSARAKVRFPGDRSPERQHAYLRALEASGVHVVLGKFEKVNAWLRVTTKHHQEAISPHLNDPDGSIQSAFDEADKSISPDSIAARVWRFGEKGTDVNLASYLLRDVWTNGLSHAMVITGDSDLVTPIKMAVNEGLTVKTLLPNGRHFSNDLRLASTESRIVDSSMLYKCQFPRSVVTAKGASINRPDLWD
jgi:uncharacterized LabA/DUF88 family protein